jgi:MoxR-like ATPase
MGRTLREIPIDGPVQDYLIRIVRSTHPTSDDATDEVKKFVRHGASPRGAQAMLAASRGRALLAGRYHASREDVSAVAVPALRHRIILSFEGEAEGLRTDQIVESVVERVS